MYTTAPLPIHFFFFPFFSFFFLVQAWDTPASLPPCLGRGHGAHGLKLKVMLQFNKSMNAIAFAKKAGEPIEVLRSSKGNLYFACGEVWGKVSKNWDTVPTSELMVSVCTDTETGDVFPMLHCAGERKSELLATIE